MGAAINNGDLTCQLTLKKAIAIFFRANTPESVKVLSWKMLQCWVTRDCVIKSDLSDEEIAQFFDQLIDLVAAAYVVHEANRSSDPNSKEGQDD